ncbi:hypothetical protein BH20ACT2_BH20ACT2_02210 [soil metagenome]
MRGSRRARVGGCVLVVLAMVVGAMATAMPAEAQERGPDRGVAATPEEVEVIESPPSQRPAPAAPVGRFGPPGPTRKPSPVEELVERRTATSDAWVNSDGTRSVTVYDLPRYFQGRGSEEWLPIDTTVAPDPDRPDRVVSTANSWSVSFGSAGAPSAAPGAEGQPAGRADLSPERNPPGAASNAQIVTAHLGQAAPGLSGPSFPFPEVRVPRSDLQERHGCGRCRCRTAHRDGEPRQRRIGDRRRRGASPGS